VNVCSPKATMTLYDIFLHTTRYPTSRKKLLAHRRPIAYLSLGKAYKNTGCPRRISKSKEETADLARDWHCETNGQNLEKIKPTREEPQSNVENSPALLMPRRTRHHWRDPQPRWLADRIQTPMQRLLQEMDLFRWRV
jgi:hypothetical protein